MPSPTRPERHFAAANEVPEAAASNRSAVPRLVTLQEMLTRPWPSAGLVDVGVVADPQFQWIQADCVGQLVDRDFEGE